MIFHLLYFCEKCIPFCIKLKNRNFIQYFTFQSYLATNLLNFLRSQEMALSTFQFSIAKLISETTDHSFLACA
ncbi:hypothetical protein PRO82_000035 [Candidatus Protochlamydia amoebophila]|nr:hypothetical protein [Candidatus Protochlamydia amoebophila]